MHSSFNSIEVPYSVPGLLRSEGLVDFTMCHYLLIPILPLGHAADGCWAW
jgi:hypothetical protein